MDNDDWKNFKDNFYKTYDENKGFLDWITEHKIYTIILLILIILGLGRIAKFLTRTTHGNK